LKDFVLALERFFVTASTIKRPDGNHASLRVMDPANPRPPGSEATLEFPDDHPLSAFPVSERPARTLAAIGAIASRYLAVGTPRTLGTIVATATDEPLAQMSVEAHATWFAPRELRNVVIDRGDSIANALACDIVCVHAPITILPSDLRRGTHVNALATCTFDDELLRISTVVRDLGPVVAGFVDGRQLDEITIFALS
jgi:hypothetical protein